MADADGMLENKEKDFGIGIPVKNQAFFLKGLDNCDWGVKNRMSRIFNPKTGRTVMLAFDHGYGAYFRVGTAGPLHCPVD